MEGHWQDPLPGAGKSKANALLLGVSRLWVKGNWAWGCRLPCISVSISACLSLMVIIIMHGRDRGGSPGHCPQRSAERSITYAPLSSAYHCSREPRARPLIPTLSETLLVSTIDYK